MDYCAGKPDPDFCEPSQRKLQTVPIVRIFGVTDAGTTFCCACGSLICSCKPSSLQSELANWHSRHRCSPLISLRTLMTASTLYARLWFSEHPSHALVGVRFCCCLKTGSLHQLHVQATQSVLSYMALSPTFTPNASLGDTAPRQMIYQPSQRLLTCALPLWLFPEQPLITEFFLTLFTSEHLFAPCPGMRRMAAAW